IGQEDAVRIQGQRLRSSSLRGHYRDATVTLRQHAQDVAFYAEVISHYVEGLLMLQHRMTFAPLPQPLIPLVSLGGRDNFCQIHALQTRETTSFRQCLLLAALLQSIP